MRTTATLHPNGYRVCLAHDYPNGVTVAGVAQRGGPAKIGGRYIVIDFEVAPFEPGGVTFQAADMVTSENVTSKLNQRQRESIESHCRTMAPIIKAAREAHDPGAL